MTLEEGREKRLREFVSGAGRAVCVRCEAEPEMRSFALRVPSS